MSNSDRRAWLEKVYIDDTLLALELMALDADDCPEAVAIRRCVERIHMLVSIHRLRLCGAEVTREGGLFILSLPDKGAQ